LCKDSTTVNIYEPNKLVVSVTAIKNATCYGYSDGRAIANAIGGNGNYQWYWNTNPNQSSNNANNLSKGWYKVVVNDIHNCKDSTSIFIDEPMQIVPKISNNRFTIANISHELSSTVTPNNTKYHYSWQPTSIYGTSTDWPTIRAMYSKNTIVTLKVTDANGCSGIDTAHITVLIPFENFFPNAFSPNADGINDRFELPDYFEIKEFKIFNRWGELLFNDPNLGYWDGKYMDETVPIGSYLFTVTAKLKGTTYNLNHSGMITLIK
jgi:gliding motility-associated-like protein